MVARHAPGQSILFPPDIPWTAPAELPSLTGVKRLGVDVETCDPDLNELGPGTRRGAYIVGLCLATDDGRSWYLPVRHQGNGNLDCAMVFRWAREELNAFDGIVVGANLSYDLDFLAVEGITFPLVKRFHDVQIAEPLLDEHKLSYSLDSLAQEYLGEKKQQAVLEEAATAWGFGATDKQIKQNLWRLHAGYVGLYGESDAAQPLRILDLQMKKLEEQDLLNLFDLESRLLPILVAMRRRGVRVDVGGAHRVRARLVIERDAALAKVRRLAGPKAELMAPDSFAQALVDRGLPVGRTPKSGQYSITKGWMQQHEGDELVDAILAGRKVNTIITTFIDGHIFNHAINGRIHCQYKQLKDDEGGTGARFCVAGDTVLSTSNGNIRIDELVISENDYIETHTGYRRKILRKFFKGYGTMFQITLQNGSQVKCTANHRLLTPSGWRHVSDLDVGSFVISNDRHKSMDRGSNWLKENSGFISFRPEAYYDGDKQTNRSQSSNYYIYTEKRSFHRATQSREISEIPSKQDWKFESDEWASNRTSPELQRGDIQRRRLSYEENYRENTGQEVHWSTCSDNVRTFTYRLDAVWNDRSPYRRRQNEQSSRQLSYNDKISSWPSPRVPTRVVSIKKIGKLPIWDIEVDVDHSYWANGFIHHNSSSSPNLQNIPSRDAELAPLVRGLFLPDEGEEWERHDAQQAEYRLQVHYARGTGAKEARQKYNDDPSTDFHKFCAEMLGADPEDKLIRKRIKNTNFAKSYGALAPKLALTFGCTVEEAQAFIKIYEDKLPFTKTTFDAAQAAASQKGFIRSVLGRYARFPLWEPADNSRQKTQFRKRALPREAAEAAYGKFLVRAGTYKALNNLLQFSNADLTKKAMVDIWEAGLCAGGALGPFLLQVHDELDYSVPMTLRGDEAAREAKHLMEIAVPLRVPMLVDAQRGVNWGACG